MTLKENAESMESKIQEIERFVADVVDADPEHCSNTRCRNCGLNHPETTVKGQACAKVYKKTIDRRLPYANGFANRV